MKVAVVGGGSTYTPELVSGLSRLDVSEFVLHDIEGYQHQEIAEQLGIAVGTVKAQLHRAHKLLIKALDR